MLHLNRPPCASAYHWGAAAFEFHAASPGSVTSCDGVPDLPCTAAGGAFTGFYYSSTCEAGSSTTIANATTLATTTVADNPNLANQVCCDADAGSQISAPTIIACTDHPEGRVGRFWSGQIVCLSDGNGGYPKTAAGVLPCPRSYVLCGAKGNQRHLSNPPAPPPAPCPFPPHPTAPCCLGSVRV